MFGNLAVIDAEDIDDRVAAVLRVAGRMNMKKHEIAIGRAAHDRGACLGVCFEALRKEADKRCRPAWYVRIVLNVIRRKHGAGDTEIVLIEYRVVEVHDQCAIAIFLGEIARLRGGWHGAIFRAGGMTRDHSKQCSSRERTAKEGCLALRGGHMKIRWLVECQHCFRHVSRLSGYLSASASSTNC